MIDCHNFLTYLQQNGVEFFAGVPDSLLKDICAALADEIPASHHIIAANEGNALAMAAGYHLATRSLPFVYMQNSGLGNLVNPLTSLMSPEVYGIPCLMLVGWRAEPGVKDEPQHAQQGRITPSLLDVLGVPRFELSADNKENFPQILNQAIVTAKERSAPVALLVRKDAFGPYKQSKTKTPVSNWSREAAVQAIAKKLRSDDVVLSTTGHISRELYDFRTRVEKGKCRDFLSVGSMGHVSQIAMGISIGRPSRRVFCLDGDGSVLMHMGALGIIGSHQPNLYHICLNNAAHGSVGGQPTVADKVRIAEVAQACGYRATFRASAPAQFEAVWTEFQNSQGPSFLEILCGYDARKDLPRPRNTPKENKHEFMNQF